VYGVPVTTKNRKQKYIRSKQPQVKLKENKKVKAFCYKKNTLKLHTTVIIIKKYKMLFRIAPLRHYLLKEAPRSLGAITSNTTLMIKVS